jgi:hypothetical protein
MNSAVDQVSKQGTIEEMRPHLLPYKLFFGHKKKEMTKLFSD